jgi:hypothetical protein
MGNCSSVVSRRRGGKYLTIRESVTEERVRDAVVEIAGIETEDLLYFSHSNKALSHLPYMIALDRQPLPLFPTTPPPPLLSFRSSLSPLSPALLNITPTAPKISGFLWHRDTKTVVVAIRGTMSLADLVTDAVVHPESLAAWMPTATRKVPFPFFLASFRTIHDKILPQLMTGEESLRFHV